MAGACIGFLAHNRYKAKVFMGDTGSLALGGGLAAMAACTGMFLPLFIASGVFFLETVSVMAQVILPSPYISLPFPFLLGCPRVQIKDFLCVLLCHSLFALFYVDSPS